MVWSRAAHRLCLSTLLGDGILCAVPLPATLLERQPEGMQSRTPFSGHTAVQGEARTCIRISTALVPCQWSLSLGIQTPRATVRGISLVPQHPASSDAEGMQHIMMSDLYFAFSFRHANSNQDSLPRPTRVTSLSSNTLAWLVHWRNLSQVNLWEARLGLSPRAPNQF